MASGIMAGLAGAGKGFAGTMNSLYTMQREDARDNLKYERDLHLADLNQKNAMSLQKARLESSEGIAEGVQTGQTERQQAGILSTEGMAKDKITSVESIAGAGRTHQVEMQESSQLHQMEMLDLKTDAEINAKAELMQMGWDKQEEEMNSYFTSQGIDPSSPEAGKLRGQIVLKIKADKTKAELKKARLESDKVYNSLSGDKGTESQFQKDLASEMKLQFPDKFNKKAEPSQSQLMQYYHDGNLIFGNAEVDAGKTMKSKESMKADYDELSPGGQAKMTADLRKQGVDNETMKFVLGSHWQEIATPGRPGMLGDPGTALPAGPELGQDGNPYPNRIGTGLRQKVWESIKNYGN